MHKKISEFLESRSFEINGNQGYGYLEGYETNVFARPLDTQSPLAVHISCHMSEENKNAAVKLIRETRIKFLKVSPTLYGISLQFNDLTMGRLIKNLPDHLERIFAILKEKGAKGREYCPMCGESLDEENSVLLSLDEATIRVDRSCFDSLNAAIERENQTFEQMPNNYAKGFAGALLGALVGVIIFVVLFFLGFISALSAFVSVILGAYLYSKLGGKKNKGMVVIVSLTSLISLVFTLFLLYVLAASGYAVEEGLALEGIDAFNHYMKNSAEFSKEFTYNLVLTIVFSLIGCGYEIYALARSIHRSKSLKQK